MPEKLAVSLIHLEVALNMRDRITGKLFQRIDAQALP